MVEVAGWASETQRQAWRAYIEASLQLEEHLDADLRAASGLSMIDYHVLLLLSEAPQQRLRMGRLARQMVFAPSRLTYQITAMEKRGLVVRERSPEDQRGLRAVLTATGLHALRCAAPHHRATVRAQFVDELDETELQTLLRVFGRLRSRLEGQVVERTGEGRSSTNRTDRHDATKETSPTTCDASRANPRCGIER